MGSENSPLVLFQGVAKAAQNFSHAHFILLATPDVIRQIQQQADSYVIPSSIIFQPISQVIEMKDEPLSSIRQNKNSSLIIGLQLLKDRQVDAFVTAGNTGALIVAATLLIPLFKQIKRPALLANLPTKKGKVTIIDVGGTVNARVGHLMQFAEMGIAYQQCLGVNYPRVGLLNIGVESKKGTLEVRRAYNLLRGRPNIDFVGNVEGREVFQGNVDVLITDGFAGNVLLKTAEGVYSFILDQLKQVLETVSLGNEEEIYRMLKTQFDYEEYMGAILCGIDGLVVKCHGATDSNGLYNAIQGACEAIKSNFIGKIKGILE